MERFDGVSILGLDCAPTQAHHLVCKACAGECLYLLSTTSPLGGQKLSTYEYVDRTCSDGDDCHEGDRALKHHQQFGTRSQGRSAVGLKAVAVQNARKR